MTGQRLRLRFGKAGDLRFISHRDLARTLERWFRRAGLQLQMSAGFHPKARLSFPSALAVGIAGRREVLDIVLTEPVPPDRLAAQLAAVAPPGLTVSAVEELAAGQHKAQLRRVSYALPIPESRRAALVARLAWLRAEPAYAITRDGRQEPLDLKAQLDDFDYRDGALHFRLPADRPVGVRPREVLAACGVADLEHEGHVLTRTDVELAPGCEVNSIAEENQDHEEGNADQCVAARGMPDCDH